MTSIKRVFVVGVTLTALVLLGIAAVQLLLPDTSVHKGEALEDYTAYLDQRIPALMRRYDIPGVSLALVKDGKIVLTQAYGYADVQTGRKLTKDNLMRMQSISKSVTAWGVMKLVEQGKIDLNAPVTQYIKSWNFPKSKYPTDQITIRQLLSHTAGMPLGDVLGVCCPTDDKPSLGESLTRTADPLSASRDRDFPIRMYATTCWSFSIEEVTGRDFEEYMTDEVLRPLGMQHATFSWSESIDPPMPNGYSNNAEAVPVYVYPEKASCGLLCHGTGHRVLHNRGHA